MAKDKNQKNSYVLIMILYLAGIFMGAIDTGIVTPARTIIQNELGVSPQSGIWMITIYTLSYAASVPVMGKLADKFGRKYIYIICISLFGLGSLLCGLSGSVIGFPLLITARVIQAIGGGGIVPIATAEFGTTFPEEKRGMALGLVGGVYGIANVFGASAGSAIMDLFGVDHWEFIFYINIPISLFIIVFGLLKLKNNRDEENNKKIDIFGIFTLTVMVLSLLYGLKNIDFFDFAASVKSTDVFPFLILFAVFIPLFILAEKKAEDPVLNLNYFTEKNILVTLILSLISGFLMMGVIFVPQFSENCLKLSSGSGGYLVIILGLFAGFGAPVSGKLIDKFGPKLILAFGFACTGLGALFMIFVTTKYPSMATVLIGLAMAGLGMGFTMGTPVNYMMLADTDPKQSNSSLAALSLVRSIGTSIAPAIMVGFIANAGMSVQDKLMAELPKEVNMPELPYAQEIEDKINEMKETSPEFAEMADKIPSLSEMGKMEINMSSNSGIELPEGTLEMLQSSDVTTIVANTKSMAQIMFAQMTPEVIAKIQDGIGKGIEGISTGTEQMKEAKQKMETALEGMSKMPENMSAMAGGHPGDTSGMPEGMAAMMGGNSDTAAQMPDGMPPMAGGNPDVPQMPDGMPPVMGGNSDASDSPMADMLKAKEEMQAAVDKMEISIGEMETLSSHMSEMKDAIPGAFDTALNDYLDEIDNNGPKLEETFQSTLNKGFSDIYTLTAVTSVIALAVLAFYKWNRKKEKT